MADQFLILISNIATVLVMILILEVRGFTPYARICCWLFIGASLSKPHTSRLFHAIDHVQKNVEIID